MKLTGTANITLTCFQRFHTFGDVVAQFMNEAANSTSPIFYSLTSIWEVIGMRRDATLVDQALMVMFNRIANNNGWLFFRATISK